jgi:CheY-like chemotaxis protein
MTIAADYRNAPDKMKILIVDDLEENLLSLEAILDSLGQTIVRARSGEEAMRLALRNDFGLMLLDVVMPGMDGYETASLLKRHHKTRDVPIIFLTAAEDSRDATFRGYAVGAADYITKPFDPWVLRAKVLVFVDLYRKNHMLASVASRLAMVEEQLRRLIPAPALPSSAEGTGPAAMQPAATAQALGQVAESMSVMQEMVRGMFPVDDFADSAQSLSLAPRAPSARALRAPGGDLCPWIPAAPVSQLGGREGSGSESMNGRL